jgi:hypothetical protein
VSDRLNELQRQRSLVVEHLQWLDKEIAGCRAQAGRTVQTPASPPVLLPPPAAASPAAASSSPAALQPAPRDTDPAFALLQEEERRRSQVSKSGCWIVFAALLLAIVGTVTAIVLVRYQ